MLSWNGALDDANTFPGNANSGKGGRPEASGNDRDRSAPIAAVVLSLSAVGF